MLQVGRHLIQTRPICRSAPPLQCSTEQFAVAIKQCRPVHAVQYSAVQFAASERCVHYSAFCSAAVRLQAYSATGFLQKQSCSADQFIQYSTGQCNFAVQPQAQSTAVCSKKAGLGCVGCSRSPRENIGQLGL